MSAQASVGRAEAAPDRPVVDQRHDAHLLLALRAQERVRYPNLLDELAPVAAPLRSVAALRAAGLACGSALDGNGVAYDVLREPFKVLALLGQCPPVLRLFRTPLSRDPTANASHPACKIFSTLKSPVGRFGRRPRSPRFRSIPLGRFTRVLMACPVRLKSELTSPARFLYISPCSRSRPVLACFRRMRAGASRKAICYQSFVD